MSGLQLLHPSNYLTLVHLKKICLQESNFTGGGGGGAEHFSDQGSPINHFMGLWGERNKGKGNALYYVSLSFITTVLPQHGIPLPCGQRMVKILRCVTHGVARLVGVPVGRMSDS